MLERVSKSLFIWLGSFIFFLFTVQLHSQERPTKYNNSEEDLFSDDYSENRQGKFFLVPELWISLGTGQSRIDVAPMVGYHVFDRFIIGLGPHYMYLSQKSQYPGGYSYQTHAYGLKGFGRFMLITRGEELLPFKLFSELFVQAEYEGLSLEKNIWVPPYTEDGRYIYRGMLLGGGFTQRIGGHNSVSFTMLWNLNQPEVTPYSNPLFRIGFNAYF